MEPTVPPSFTANVSPLNGVSGWGWKKFLIVLGSVIFIILFWQWVSSPMIVTVTGTGEVSVPATNAIVSVTLSANDSSAQGAVNSVKQKAATMRSFLISKGIAEGEIAEGQVTAVPSALVVVGAQGFQATITMGAKTVHVSDVATLVSDLYTNGALVVSQPILSVEDKDKLDQEAFKLAMKNARKEAGKVGLENWKFIRKVISISQSDSSNTTTATTKASVLEASNSIAAQNGVFKVAKILSVSYKMW